MTDESILDSPESPREPASLWSLLGEGAASVHDFYHHWLQMQCQSFPEIVQGVLILRRPDRPTFVPVAKWPLQGQATRLAEISEQVLAESCALLTKMDDIPGHLAAAYPIMVNDELAGVVGMELSTANQRDISRVMSQLQWSVGWIENLVNRRDVHELKHQVERLQSSVRLLAVVQSEQNFTSASIGLVTELATGLDCSRVSVGFPRDRHVRVEALSHSSQFGKRMNLIRAIGEAMEEAIVLGHEIVYPMKREDELLLVSHEALAREFASNAILTLPIYANDRYYCVITLERDKGEPFTREEVEYCRSIGALVAPSLEEKRLNARSIWVKMKDSLMEQFSRLVGPRYVGRKLILGTAALLAIFFTFAQGTYRVSADSVLEGEVQRVIAAPFSGYVVEVGPHAGDLVVDGQLICTLDDKDLRVERLGHLSERSQYQKEYQDALAAQDRARLAIARAQVEQAEAQLQLVEMKLERTRITAPFDGILIRGDLSQRIGGFVEQGEELFTMAPLDSYRLILHVDEKAISDVHSGQHGEVVLAAMPNETLGFVVTTVTPETEAHDGINTFRVEAILDEQVDGLRPGLEGVGKIVVDERNLFGIWVRGLVIWLRLWLWSWIP